MEDKSVKPSRATRSRRGSTDETLVATPKKTRSRSLKGIDETGESANRHDNVDDLDDDVSNVSNASSTGSVKLCKVVLRRENYDELKTDEDVTSRRASSQLTEANVAAHSSQSISSRRITRANSVTSDQPSADGTESTTRKRTSARLASSQPIASKDNNSGSRTPARRSSRLLSENEKAAASPAKRNLRSNSVVSEDPSPPTRRSSRLIESVGTPKSLKTVVSKIKAEPTTPRRASMRLNKSVIATEIIDEESDEEILASAQSQSNANQASNEQVNKDTPKDGGKRVDTIQADDEPEIIVDEPANVKPELSDQSKLKSMAKEAVTSSQAATPAKSPRAPIVLVSTTTTPEPTPSRASKKTITPATELIEEEYSLKETISPATEPIEEKNTSNELDSMNVSGKETSMFTDETDEKADQIENNEAKQANDGDITSIEPIPIQEDDDEPMDVSEIAPAAENNVQLTSNAIEPLANKNVSSIKSAGMSTPIHKSRASNAFESMDVSALAHDTPEQAKTPKRKSMNKSQSFLSETVDTMEADSSSVTPKPNGTPNRANAPESTGKLYFKINVSPKSSAGKSPKTKSPQSTKKQSNCMDESFGGDVSISLSNEIDKIVGDLYTPTNSKEVDRRFAKIVAATTPVEDVDSRIDEIATEGKTTDIETTDATSDENHINSSSVGSKSSAPVEPQVEENIDSNSLPPQNADAVVSSASEPQGEGKSDGEQNESVVNPTQSELDSNGLVDEPVAENVPASNRKSNRKSVQIMTPKMEKSQSSSKRIDTPYPDDKAIQEAAAKSAKSDELKKMRSEMHAKARESLKQMQISYTTTIKRTAIPNEPIDRSGVEESSKTEEGSAKKFVPARNNWSAASNGLITNDSDVEDEDEVIAETEQEDCEEESEEESENFGNKFHDDEAEVVEDYQSGDSMDEEEKREIQENEIKERGQDLGSDDTDYDDEENDEYEDDGFLVIDDADLDDADDDDEEQELTDASESGESDDDEEDIGKKVKRRSSAVLESSDESEDVELTDATDGDDDEEDIVEKVQRRSSAVFESSDVELTDASGSEDGDNEEPMMVKKPKRRFIAVIPSSDESEDVELTDASNSANDDNGEDDVVAVSIQNVASIVVVSGNPPGAEREQIVEGKTFATTYIVPDSELHATESASKLSAEKKKENENDEQGHETEQKVDEQQPIVAHSLDEPKVNEQNIAASEAKKRVDAEKTLQQNELAPADMNGKENKSFAKKIEIKSRVSLPGIDRLTKELATKKKKSRVSLGDLNPNITVAQLTTQIHTKKPKLNVAKAEAAPVQKQAVESTVQKDDIHCDSDASSIELTDASDSDEVNDLNTTARLDISSQEENNNQKASNEKGTVSEKVENDESIPVTVDKPAPDAQGHDAVSSTSSSEDASLSTTNVKSKLKVKRKFVEIDEEPRERPKPKKLLKAVSSASGVFIEEPMTPEKNKHGFKVTPKTPVNKNFKVEKRVHLIEPSQSNKRKSLYLAVDEDDDISQILLPKPKWQINTQFDNYAQASKRARKLEMGPTEVKIQPVEAKKSKRNRIPIDLKEYRQNYLNRAGIFRQSAYSLLRQKRSTNK